MDCCVLNVDQNCTHVQEISIEKLAKTPERDLRWSAIVDTKTKTEPNYRDILEQRINESHFYKRVKGLFLGHENTLLHVAAYFGNLLKVKAYTQLQPSVYDPLDINRQGNTALHVAVEAGHLDIVGYFIEECQVSASSLSDTGSTPLHTACQYKQYKIAKYLIHQGVDPLVENDEKETPLFVACRCGDEKMVEFLFKKAMEHQLLNDFIHSTNVSGKTVLHCAVESGNVQLVKFLISKYKMPPEISEGIIHSAVSTGSVEMVSYFCSLRNCNTNAVDSTGHTAIHIAAEKGFLDILQFFFTNGCCKREYFHIKNVFGYTPLYTAAKYGHIDCVKYLLEFVNGNVGDTFENTPLHVATVGGHFEVVKLLAELYPEHAYQQNNLSLTPLHLAVGSLQNMIPEVDWTAEHIKDEVPPPSSEYFKIVKFLILKMNCDPNCGDKHGCTPFHYAAMYSSLEIVKFLVKETKTNPSIRCKQYNLPLHLACRTGRKDVVQFLFESGKSIREDNGGRYPTALHCAALCEKPDVFFYLTTKQGYVPSKHYNILKYAAMGGCVRTIEYLVHSGCNTTNEPILATACIHGHIDAVRYLMEECGCGSSKADLRSSIQGAAKYGHYDVLEYLTLERQGDLNSENSWDQTILHVAVRGRKRGYDLKSVKANRMKTIKLLVEDLNCCPNHPDSNANTPLQLACMMDKMEIVCYFLGKCKVVKDHFGRNPLHWAAMGSAYEVVEYLISQHYNPLCKDKDGNTPLHLIASCGELSTEDKISRFKKSLNPVVEGVYDTDLNTMLEMSKHFELSVTKYLIYVMQGDTSVTNNLGQAPIHLACERENVSIVQDLKQALSSTFTLQDSIGRTPLHYAAMGGHVNIARNLIYFKADLLSEDVFHNLPLHYAAALGHLDIVQFLVNIGSPLTARGVWDKTPAEMAAAGGHKNVLDYLDSLQSEIIVVLACRATI